jgi:hypothetical protein
MPIISKGPSFCGDLPITWICGPASRSSTWRESNDELTTCDPLVRLLLLILGACGTPWLWIVSSSDMKSTILDGAVVTLLLRSNGFIRLIRKVGW